MFESVVVVDCKNHLLGRLCSTIAKELLNGQHVVLVRCEEAVVSGSLIRRKYEMLRWMNKKMLTNPRKGPLHYRAPSRMLCRMGRLATEVGWKYGELVKKLEEKRSIRGAAFHAKKKATLKLKAKAAASVDLSKENTVLAAAGYA